MTISPRHVTLGIVLAGVSLASVALTLKWRDDRAFGNEALQLSRFPAEPSAVLQANFALLRRGGQLNAQKIELEPEYKQFVEGTGFDYRRDLDQVTASFSQSGNFFLVRGRFDWARLQGYVRLQGGDCYQQLCRMQGSKPERHISFLPLREDVMALAVSSDDLAATHLSETRHPVSTPLPDAPVWLVLPGSVLRQPGLLPPGMRLLLSGLTAAERMIFTITAATGGMEARLDAACLTKDDAGLLASQLRNTARVVREGIAGKTVAADDDLAKTLAVGAFEQNGNRVTGRWLLAKGLLESLTAGI